MCDKCKGKDWLCENCAIEYLLQNVDYQGKIALEKSSNSAILKLDGGQTYE